jgi:hypothetical protein
LPVSPWIRAYSEGVSSAREIEREMEWEPGFQWLGGLEKVNHHTLSDFRVEHQAGLDLLFGELLGLLEHAGCSSLERVMHDGTKIRAQAAPSGPGLAMAGRSLKGCPTCRPAALVLAPVRSVGVSLKEHPERAARERQERVERAYEELQARRREKGTEQDKQAVRVSMTEPEARMMKHGGNAIAPGDFVGGTQGDGLRRPAGCRLKFPRQNKKRDNLYRQYQARGVDCQGCAHQRQCCPRHPEQGRVVSIPVEERAEVAEFRKKMQTPEAKAICRQWGPVAEFSNAWIKEKLG